MSLDLNNDYKDINNTINSYKTTVELKKTEKETVLKNQLGDSEGIRKSDASKPIKRFR